MSEAYSGRRGFGGQTAETPSGHGVEEHGPVLMEGHTKRQGDGWKGMKPWNERYAALALPALVRQISVGYRTFPWRQGGARGWRRGTTILTTCALASAGQVYRPPCVCADMLSKGRRGSAGDGLENGQGSPAPTLAAAQLLRMIAIHLRCPAPPTF